MDYRLKSAEPLLYFKQKRSGVNLLAGRAWQANLFPLVSHEIEDFDIIRYLQYGGLPQVYTSDYPEEELDAYTF